MNQQAIDDLRVKQFWERGYAILPGMYTPEEIQDLRDGAYETRNLGGDLLANPRLSTVLTDGRMAAVARKLLRTDGPIHYGGDATFTINGTQRGWHKDNTDRKDRNAPDWTQGRYTQLRFGIYCQDHTKHTGGLNLKVGSHRQCNLKDGETKYVKVKPGDLAVWSMRITHSGNGTLLRWPFTHVPDPSEFDSIPEWKKTKADGDRIAIFAHLGADDAHAQRYGDYLRTRKYMVDIWRKSPAYTPEQLAAAEAVGLKVRDMHAEIAADPNAGSNVEWTPFPY